MRSQCLKSVLKLRSGGRMDIKTDFFFGYIHWSLSNKEDPLVMYSESKWQNLLPSSILKNLPEVNMMLQLAQVVKSNGYFWVLLTMQYFLLLLSLNSSSDMDKCPYNPT